MTFSEWIHNYLDSDLMLFSDSIKGITQAFKESPVNKAMTERWEDNVQGYPEVLFKAMKLHLDTIALEWLQVNQPQHFIIRYLQERLSVTV